MSPNEEKSSEPLVKDNVCQASFPDSSVVVVDVGDRCAANNASGSSCANGSCSNGDAIRITNAYKHYGRGKSRTPVLLGLDMRVQRGQIYGLLGPSGCGKTTLLKCMVGKLRVESGSVLVFGEAPGAGGTGVPGARVGYMPQELALFLEFNIEETLTYFRRVFGMSRAKYEERLNFLMKFLDLPSKKRSLINMSGGQQRRASLAVALLHEPELLILDEPTVGVDPLLRASIWDHLSEMTSTTITTIVITTHYIEEARQAHRVGMMRFGKLLAEDSPENLLTSYSKSSLEDVFLELCLQDGDLETAKVREDRAKKEKKASKKQKSSGTEVLKPLRENGTKEISSEASAVSAQTAPAPPSTPVLHSRVSAFVRSRRQRLSNRKVIACMLKTFNRMKKRIGFLIYQFILPALQVSLFCLAIGQDPKELPLAVVNLENSGNPCDGYPLQCPMEDKPGKDDNADDEDDQGTEAVNAVIDDWGVLTSNENLVNFTCRYLSFLDDSIISPVYYHSVEEATQAVENGEAWGVVTMDQNFTSDLYNRILDTQCGGDIRTINEGLLDRSSIKIRMDITNQHIAFTLQLKLAEAFEQFMTQLVRSCEIPEEVANIPLVFQDPIYGSEELTFTDFMAPGIILTIVHSMALGFSAMIIIMERNEGLLDRTWVAGVTPGEFSLAHFLVSLVVNFLQVVVTLIFMIFVFQVPNEGSFFWVFLLTMLQGVCGTTIGLIISAVCETQQDATQIALGIFYPNLIMSGIIWPIESMPLVLRYISYALPQTFACEAMRGILLRGWGITYMPVYRGFVVTIAWIILTYLIFKRLVVRQG